MDVDTFTIVCEEQLETCRKVLIDKAAEYATADRLHNFRVAATLGDTTVIQSVAGMMVKHTTSIYDMVRAPEGTWDMAMWDEKITDHMNYLILLKAAVHESVWGDDKLKNPQEKDTTRA